MNLTDKTDDCHSCGMILSSLLICMFLQTCEDAAANNGCVDLSQVLHIVQMHKVSTEN